MPQLRHTLKSEGENPEKSSSSPPPRTQQHRAATLQSYGNRSARVTRRGYRARAKQRALQNRS